VLVKEKNKSVSVPALSIVCDTVASTFMGVSSGGQTGLKRKQVPSPFSFSATKICISLHAPIETIQNQAGTVTGVPSGNSNKEVVYDLSSLIVDGKDVEYNVSHSSCLLTCDEELVNDE